MDGPEEFDCARCGIHVYAVMGRGHPENVYCQVCSFIERIDDEIVRDEVAKALDRIHGNDGE